MTTTMLQLSPICQHLKFRSIKNDNGTKLKPQNGFKDPSLNCKVSNPGEYMILGTILSNIQKKNELHIYNLFNDQFCEDGLFMKQFSAKDVVIEDICLRNIRIDKTTRDRAKTSLDKKIKLLREYGLSSQYTTGDIKNLNYDHVLISFDLFWRNKSGDAWQWLDNAQENLFDEKHINNNSPNIEKLIPYKNKYGIIIDGKKSFMKKYDYFVEVRSKDNLDYRRIDKLSSKHKQFARFYNDLNSETDAFLRITSDGHFCSKEIMLKDKHYKKMPPKMPGDVFKIFTLKTKMKSIPKVSYNCTDFPEVSTEGEFPPLEDIEASISPDDEVQFDYPEEYGHGLQSEWEIPPFISEMEVETSTNFSDDPVLTSVNSIDNKPSILSCSSSIISSGERELYDGKSPI